jgi:hypothetical protein
LHEITSVSVFGDTQKKYGVIWKNRKEMGEKRLTNVERNDNMNITVGKTTGHKRKPLEIQKIK